MGRVQRHRRKQGIHLLLEELGRERALCGAHRLPAEDPNPRRIQRRLDVPGPSRQPAVLQNWCRCRPSSESRCSWVRPPSSVIPGSTMLSSSCCRYPATRISMNSSRLLAVIARNLTRSRRGLVRSSASSSTRKLNRNQLSSRLKYRPRTGLVREAGKVSPRFFGRGTRHRLGRFAIHR